MKCKVCGEVKRHRAHGLCDACYMREYRRKHPDATIRGLRREFEYLEDEVAEKWVSAMDRLLSRQGASCWREGSELVIEFQGRTFRETVT